MSKQVYFVLPKYSSYQYKDTEERIRLRDKILSWYERVSSWNKATIVCFAEDMLAIELLGDKDNVEWLHLVSLADRNFLINNLEQFQGKYEGIKGKLCDECLIRDTSRRYPILKPDELDTNYDYKQYRHNIILKRLKHVADTYIGQQNNIIYFNANNNYTKEVKPELGDGKLIVDVDMVTCVDYMNYGGSAISKENFNLLVRSVFNGNNL